jgi:hypothetical protein
MRAQNIVQYIIDGVVNVTDLDWNSWTEKEYTPLQNLEPNLQLPVFSSLEQGTDVTSEGERSSSSPSSRNILSSENREASLRKEENVSSSK